ncbi:acetyl-CoA C-acetyltransferase [Rickettsiales endosymbiont of Stachyamoeba lipophora]|uniref:acetyl-CoA C-acetyltransferase n=1 Tax=Rickettsiales endosymbiont of Stachyamoeba lipophora TaxID=2486578 RepID=UPI000F64C7F6|nr:acetyl-CoA C-acetyltransferase [Rickettsiales endosymbiont of Stachyamoeba lipophora]AZL15291.1 acetyl-CoA C-acetyltransferase [Rickettsiales endosymbiont of Stachyamoeba lipophora]
MEVVIIDAIRTAVGSFNGTLSKIAAHDLGANLIKEIINRNNLKNNQIDEVIIGQVLTTAQGQNPARQATIKAGLDISTPAFTINQVCGSGLKSVALGMMAIKSGNADIIIAGGQENMSMAPHAIHLRDGTKMGDGKLVDTMLFDGLTDIFNNYSMGITAENIAKKWNISREEQDKLSLESQNKAENAIKTGRFKEEIIPIKVKQRKEEITFEQDEFPKFGTTLDSLAKLRPAFDPSGTVTAGNASGINDGAAMILLMSRTKAQELGLKPLASIKAWAQAGVEPEIMGTGPIEAVKKALAKSAWQIKDLDLIESNEAFAAQALCVSKELGLDLSKVNVNGGSIAIGHPIGASGTRVLVTLLHEMKRSNRSKGLATLCIGGGMGIALTVELEK